MKIIGFLLLIGGFLGAAYSTALSVSDTDWVLFVPAAAAAALGVVLVKLQSRGEARSESVLAANRVELAESLSNIVATLDNVATGTDLRELIDDRLRNDLRRFADARESLVHLYGLQAYATIMSDFASGERYLNRVWSATADGYDGEARDYLSRAAVQFRDAQTQLSAAA